MSTGLFKMLPTNYSFKDRTYLKYMYKQDLIFNNPQGLIYHKTQPSNHSSVSSSSRPQQRGVK